MILPFERMLPAEEKIAELERAGLAYTRGSILNAPANYTIAHQCNCVTVKAAGLASLLFRVFPHANTYSQRGTAKGELNRSTPGTASIHANGRVANLYAQFQPGSANSTETYDQRMAWLRSSLDDAYSKLCGASIQRGVRFALPAGIGCDLAGGSWGDYATALRAWLDAHSDVQMMFYVV